MLASIDIGTNTIRCLITGSENRLLVPDYVDMRIIRLGENFSSRGVISEEAFARLKDSLAFYIEKIKSFGVNFSDIVVTGTSVLRDAPNSKRIISEVQKELGVCINVISGDTEADITLKGIFSCLKNINNFYSIDIGGGSTEFACFKEGLPVWKYSLDMGVVHLTEKFIKSDPVSGSDLNDMETEIDSNLNSLRQKIFTAGFSFEPFELIGTAGTATTLAMVDMELAEYDREKIHGYVLERVKMEEIYRGFIKKNVKERSEITGVEHGREDLILAGTSIMYKSMDFFGTNSFRVSECGLLEGLIGYKFLNNKSCKNN